jgi:ankyrin repeat protein
MRALAALLLMPIAWGGSATEAKARDAAARAIALIQSSQKGWSEQQNCVSCHHQFQPAVAFRSAREHGIPVDEKLAREIAVHAFDYSDLDTLIQYNQVIEPAMTDAYQLVAADAAGVRPNLGTAIMARLLVSRQSADGHWDSFHQRPPSSYSRFTQTALGLMAIQTYGHSSQKDEVKEHVLRAAGWLFKNVPRDTEERSYQLIGLSVSGVEEVVRKRLGLDLLKTQQADGGWGSIEGRESEAYSTGEALMALGMSGVLVSDTAYQKGIDFLLKTQMPDGSWHVKSRLHPPAPVSPPYFESGYPYGHDQFLSAQGSAWAVTALAEAAGGNRAASLPRLREAEPVNAEPWIETMLFGTVADVKKLLDSGFDPNSATKSGATTALMMAAPDAGKIKLLLDRGADVNARSKTGYSALMVAAQYRESTAAMRLLLDRGAKISSEKPALFRAGPFFLASYAGNAEILGALKAAGANLEEPMILIGTSSTTPLMGAVRFGNLEVARKLVELGASVNQTDGSGITPIGRAVLGNQVEMARFLIERGAEVNHTDKLGMTPLLYAASIDFGDSAMVEVLLQAGAKREARNKEGLTAIELARKYGNSHLLTRLEGKP